MNEDERTRRAEMARDYAEYTAFWSGVGSPEGYSTAGDGAQVPWINEFRLVAITFLRLMEDFFTRIPSGSRLLVMEADPRVHYLVRSAEPYLRLLQHTEDQLAVLDGLPEACDRAGLHLFRLVQAHHAMDEFVRARGDHPCKQALSSWGNIVPHALSGRQSAQGCLVLLRWMAMERSLPQGSVPSFALEIAPELLDEACEGLEAFLRWRRYLALHTDPPSKRPDLSFEDFRDLTPEEIAQDHAKEQEALEKIVSIAASLEAFGLPVKTQPVSYGHDPGGLDQTEPRRGESA